jgi:hypothetical protein
MSRRGNIRKRKRQKRRNERSSKKLAPSISPITGETQQSFQLPADLKRISTAALIAEIQRRPDSRGLITALAEQVNRA